MAAGVALQRIALPQQKVGVQVGYEELLVKLPGRLGDRIRRFLNGGIEPPVDVARRDRKEKDQSSKNDPKQDEHERFHTSSGTELQKLAYIA